jgi:hypothetical protein
LYTTDSKYLKGAEMLLQEWGGSTLLLLLLLLLHQQLMSVISGYWLRPK